MPFSHQVKGELARHMPPQRCCQVTELSTLLRLDGKAAEVAGGWDVELTVSNPTVARKALLLFKEVLGPERPELRRVSRGGSRRCYAVRAASAAGVTGELVRAARDGFSDPDLPLPPRVCCRRALLRAVVLCRGWFSEPGRQNHMEIVLDEAAARYVERCFASLSLSVRSMRRKAHRVLYVKDGDTIVDILNHTGAHAALLEFENARIAKDVRNAINRVVNCETANVDKTVAAAMAQIEAIRRIDAHLGLANLPPKLQEAAELRAKYPYASLHELAELTSPQVTRSAVMYRLRRLMEIAEKLPHGST